VLGCAGTEGGGACILYPIIGCAGISKPVYSVSCILH
jgi:hypothetical protein